MKTVRFSQVVEKSGKPEVYLPLSKSDPALKKAIAAHRVMTLLGEAHGSKNDYGEVGFKEKAHGQFLIFPKSLKAFAGMKVVGIKYGLFEGAEESSSKAKNPAKAVKKTSKSKAKPKSKKTVENKAGEEDGIHDKIVAFPRRDEEVEGDEEDDYVEELKGYAQKALDALEKGNQVAAYNLLKLLLKS